ncbi:uncharacterized protein LOC141911926 isoform X2 [Tubulanus polymorphus]|uniref:uncharacterized protein LOC141911926 isoform X2 n=1 Tax=Tubulanus polymorphus TaxID=672921 RepID=UPI003DA4CE29
MFKKLRQKIEQAAEQIPAKAESVVRAGKPSEVDAFAGPAGLSSRNEPKPVIPSDDGPHRHNPAGAYGGDLMAFDSAPPTPTKDPSIGTSVDELPATLQLDASNSSQIVENSRRSSISSITSEGPMNSSMMSTPGRAPSYVLQSDIESEIDEPPSFNLDNYSKDEIFVQFQKAVKRLQRYKTRFNELKVAYKDMDHDREKLKTALAMSQDKQFRRISELKEQTQLDQLAKQDLENNYRLMLEEKDELVRVLQTQVKLLKEGKEIPPELLGDSEPASAAQSGDQADGHAADESATVTALKEKVKRLEVLLNKCKDTIKSNKEKHAQLISEKDYLQKQLLEALNSPKTEGDEDDEKLRAQISEARKIIEDLETSKVMAIAETKQEMHLALESKDDELKQMQETCSNLKQQLAELKESNDKLQQLSKEQLEKSREIIRKLQEEKKALAQETDEKIALAEKSLEEERSNLVQELHRGKQATVSLLQKENEDKLEQAIQEQEKIWQEKFALKEREYEHKLQLKLTEKEDDMKLAIEERDLQKMAALSQQDSAKDELQTELQSMKSKTVELENVIEKLKADHKTQLDSFLAQMESNTLRHKETLAEIKVKFDTKVKEIREKCSQDYETKIDQLRQDYQTRTEELERRHEQTLNSSNSDFEVSRKQQIERLEAKHHSVLEEKQLQIELYANEIADLKSKNVDLTNCGDELTARIVELETSLNSERETSEKLIKDVENLQIQFEVDRSKLVDESTSFAARCDELNVKITLLTDANFGMNEKCDDLENRLKEKDAEVGKTEQQVAALEQQVAALEQQLAVLEEKLTAITEEKNVVDGYLREKEQTIGELTAEKSDLTMNVEAKRKEIDLVVEQYEERIKFAAENHEREIARRVEVAELQQRSSVTEISSELGERLERANKTITELENVVQELKLTESELRSRLDVEKTDFDAKLTTIAETKTICENRVVELERKLSELCERLAAEKTDADCSLAEAQAAGQALRDEHAAEKDRLNNEINDLRNKLEAKITDAGTLEGKIIHLQEVCDQLQRENEDSRTRERESENKYDEMKRTSDEHVENLTTELNALRDERGNNELLEQRKSELESAIDSLRDDRESYVKRLDEALVSMTPDVIGEEAGDPTVKLERILEAFVASRTERDKLTADLAERDAEAVELKRLNDELKTDSQNRIREFEESRVESSEITQNLEAKLNESNGKISDYEKQCETYRTTCENLEKKLSEEHSLHNEVLTELKESHSRMYADKQEEFTREKGEIVQSYRAEVEQLKQQVAAEKENLARFQDSVKTKFEEREQKFKESLSKLREKLQQKLKQKEEEYKKKADALVSEGQENVTRNLLTSHQHELDSVRNTHQAELKEKELEIEKLTSAHKEELNALEKENAEKIEEFEERSRKMNEDFVVKQATFEEKLMNSEAQSDQYKTSVIQLETAVAERDAKILGLQQKALTQTQDQNNQMESMQEDFQTKVKEKQDEIKDLQEKLAEVIESQERVEAEKATLLEKTTAQHAGELESAAAELESKTKQIELLTEELDSLKQLLELKEEEIAQNDFNFKEQKEVIEKFESVLVQKNSLIEKYCDEIREKDGVILRKEEESNEESVGKDDKIKGLKEMVAAFETKVQETESALRESEEKSIGKDDEIKELKEKVETEIQAKEGAIQEFNEKSIGKDDEIKELKERMATFEIEIQEKDAALQDSDQKFVGKDAEINELNEKIAVFKTLESEMEKLKSELGEAEKLNLEKKDLIQMLENDNSETRTKLKAVEEELEEKKEVCDEKISLITSLEENDLELQTKLKELTDKLESTEQKLQECIASYEQTIDQHKQQADALKHVLAGQKDELELLRKQTSDMENQSKMNHADLENALQTKVRESEQELLNAAEKHRDELTRVKNETKEKIGQMKQKYSTKLKEIQSVNSEHVGELESKIEALQSGVEVLDAEKCEAIADNDNLRVKIDELETRCGDKDAEISSLKTLVADANSALDSTKTDNEKYESELGEKNSLLESYSSQIDELKKTHDELSAKNDELRKVISELESSSVDSAKLEETAREKHVLDERVVELLANNRELNEKLSELRNEKERLQNDSVGRDGEMQTLLSELESEKRRLEAKLDAEKSERETSTAEHEKLIVEMKADYKEKMQKLVDEGNKKLTELKKKAELKLTQIKRTMQGNRDDVITEMTEQIARLQDQISTFEETVDRLTAEKNDLNAEFESTKSENSKYRDEISEKLAIKEAELTEATAATDSKLGKFKKLIQSLKAEQEEQTRMVARLEKELAESETQRKTLGEQFELAKHDFDVDMRTLKLEHENEVDAMRRNYEDRIEDSETMTNSRLKQLVKEFNLKMAEKEKEFQSVFGQAYEKSQAAENKIGAEHQEQMEELLKDLHEKDQHMDKCIEEYEQKIKDLEAERDGTVDELHQEIDRLDKLLILRDEEHRMEVAGIESRIDETVDARMKQKQTAHAEELDGLMKEWNIERKPIDNSTDCSPAAVAYVQELVRQNQLALTAFSSSSTGSELLRQQIIHLTKQLDEWKSKYKLDIAELSGNKEMVLNKLDAPLLQLRPTVNDDGEELNETQQLELYNMNLQAHISQQNAEIAQLKIKDRDFVQRMEMMQARLNCYERGETPPPSPCNMNHSGINNSSSVGGGLLCEATEYEYLKNILYQYMLGKETKVLARVLCTIMRFSKDQAQHVIEREEAKLVSWLRPVRT